MPKRIQRKRTKGWKMPEGAVYVGRPTRWGNPFFVGHHCQTYKEAVDKYAHYMLPYSHHGEYSSMVDFMLSETNLSEMMNELAGKDLACWCPLDRPCHADFLLEMANTNQGNALNT